MRLFLWMTAMFGCAVVDVFQIRDFAFDVWFSFRGGGELVGGSDCIGTIKVCVKVRKIAYGGK